MARQYLADLEQCLRVIDFDLDAFFESIDEFFQLALYAQ